MMEDHNARIGASSWWLLALSLALPSTLWAQTPVPEAPVVPVVPAAPATQPLLDEPATKPQGKAPATLDLDLALMLQAQATDLWPATVDDPVWSIKPATGRRLIQIPLVVKPETQAVELDNQTVRISGGRLLCWRVDANLMPDLDSPPVPRQDPDARDHSMPGGQPPRVARSVIIKPDGLTQWNLDRVVLNGTLKEPAQLFTYRIRPDLLDKVAPDRPAPLAPPAGGGRPNASAIAGHRQQMQNYQRELAKHNEYRRQVLKAPTEFSSPLPRAIWAVFEIRSNQNELTLEGPAPLPWSITISQWEALRALCQPIQASPGAALPATTANQLRQAITLLQQDKQVWNQRAAARAAALSRAVSASRPGDALFQLYQLLLQGDDPQARQIVLNDLLSVNPATESVLDLLKIAMAKGDGASRNLALQGLLRSGAWDENLSKIAIQTANLLLQDPENAPVNELLGQWIAAVPVPASLLSTPAVPQPGPNQPPQSPAELMTSKRAADLIAGLQLAVADSTRQNRIVRYVIHQAPSQPLAQAWLHQRLLASGNDDLIKLTLQNLAQAKQQQNPNAAPQPGMPAPQPGFRRLPTPDWDEPMRMPPGFPAAQPLPASAAVKVPDTGPVELSGLIPLHPSKDALFQLLSSKDKSVRELAWQALPQFAFPAQDPPAPVEQRPNQPAPTSPFQLLVNAALGVSPTPLPLIDFLVRQPNIQRATETLVAMVVAADAPGSAAAIKALTGSNRTIHAVLQSYAPEDRQRFAARVYENDIKTTPAVTNLLLDRGAVGANLCQWLGQQMAEGNIPAPAEWYGQINNEQQLLAMVFDPDPNLAQGAISTLVAAAGGQDDLAKTLVAQLRGQTNRSPEFLLGQWAKAKREIHALKLAKSSGEYRLILRVYSAETALRLNLQADTDPGIGAPTMNPDGPQAVRPNVIQPGVITPGFVSPTATKPAALPAHKPDVDAVLGVVNLQADGKTVRFANQTVNLSVPDAYLAIRIDKPGELKNFPNDAVAKLNLDSLLNPIDLRPRKDGQWRARTLMSDERLLELVLEPVKKP